PRRRRRPTLFPYTTLFRSTLLSHGGELTAEVRAAVAELRDAAAHVVLATGRSVQGTLPVARQLGLSDVPAVCSNGAVCLALAGGDRKSTRLNSSHVKISYA